MEFSEERDQLLKSMHNTNFKIKIHTDCPECGLEADSAATTGDSGPNDGDGMICPQCGLVTFFSLIEGTFMPGTQEQFDTIMNDGLTPNDLFVVEGMGLTLHHIPRVKPESN